MYEIPTLQAALASGSLAFFRERYPLLTTSMHVASTLVFLEKRSHIHYALGFNKSINKKKLSEY